MIGDILTVVSISGNIFLLWYLLESKRKYKLLKIEKQKSEEYLESEYRSKLAETNEYYTEIRNAELTEDGYEINNPYFITEVFVSSIPITLSVEKKAPTQWLYRIATPTKPIFIGRGFVSYNDAVTEGKKVFSEYVASANAEISLFDKEFKKRLEDQLKRKNPYG